MSPRFRLSEGLKAQNFQDMKPIQRKVLPLALGGHATRQGLDDGSWISHDFSTSVFFLVETPWNILNNIECALENL